MAINPLTQYPGKISSADPTGYPYGKARDITTPGDGTGTPLQAAWVNDVFGFFQAILDDGGTIVPSGTPDKVGASQYLTAIKAIITASAGNSGVWGSVVEIEDADLTSGEYTFSTAEVEAGALYVYTGSADAKFNLPAVALAQTNQQIWIKNDAQSLHIQLEIAPNGSEKIDLRSNRYLFRDQGTLCLTEVDNTGFTNVSKQWVSNDPIMGEELISITPITSSVATVEVLTPTDKGFEEMRAMGQVEMAVSAATYKQLWANLYLNGGYKTAGYDSAYNSFNKGGTDVIAGFANKIIVAESSRDSSAPQSRFDMNISCVVGGVKHGSGEFSGAEGGVVELSGGTHHWTYESTDSTDLLERLEFSGTVNYTGGYIFLFGRRTV